MRLRLMKVARRVVSVLAVTVLVWPPVSYFIFATFQSPLPSPKAVNLYCVSGVVECIITESGPPDLLESPVRFHYEYEKVSALRNSLPPSKATDMMLHPASFQCARIVALGGLYSVLSVALPMWLITLVLSAWPIAHFLAVRSHRRVGFPVSVSSSV